MRAAAVLNITRDGEIIRKVPVEGEAMLGRAEGCLIRLDDRAISRQHALFKAVGDGVQVERKSDFAPLVVNGEECTRAVLKEGDVIALGPYLVRLSISKAREDGPRGGGSSERSGDNTGGTPVTAPKSVSAAASAAASAAGASAQAAPPSATIPLPPTGGQSAAAALAAFNSATAGAGAGVGVPGITNAPPVATGEVREGSLDLLGAPTPFRPPAGTQEVNIGDLGPMGGLELAADPAAGEGNGLQLPGAPMDAPGFALGDASLSGGSGVVDPDGETRPVPVADLRAKLVLRTGKAPKSEYDLKKGETSVGRGKDCDIVLDDKKVSRRNTVIVKQGNRFVIRDMGSANGTYVNGKAIAEETLFGEDIVRIGNEEFEFQALSDSYARREKDFMAVTQGSLVGALAGGGAAAFGAEGAPDITLPPPIFGPGGGGSALHGLSGGMPAELQIPSDLRSPEDGQPVLYAVNPANMIPMGSGLIQAPPSDAVTNGMGGMPAGIPGGVDSMSNAGLAQPPAGAIPGFGDPVANPLGIPGLTGIPGGQSQPKGLLAKLNALPPRRRLIAFAMIGAILYFGIFDDDEAPQVQGHKPKAPIAVASALPAAPTGASFDSLSPEKKQYIEAQHQLAFDHYRNQEYEKALHEVQKIFDIIPDYKDSREIERYAKEGLRKQQAEEEEQRRKQDELLRKQQIEGLLGQIRDRMAKRDYAAARELFARVIELDPENQSIADYKKQIDDWEEQLRIKQQEKEVQDQINQRAWDIFKEGMALKKRGKYHAAIATFARVPDVGASDRRVLVSARTMIATCKAIIRARRDPVLKAAHAAEDGGELKKALDLYVKATVIDPPHPEGWAGASRVKALIHDRSKATYTEAVLAESYSDFDTARRKYQEILDNTPSDEDYHGRAQRKLEKYIGLRGLAGGGDDGSGGGGAPPPVTPAGGGGAPAGGNNGAGGAPSQ